MLFSYAKVFFFLLKKTILEIKVQQKLRLETGNN